jgi:acyl-coenzyme A synthetase/AMP-(fatty) acid ligase
MNNLSFGNLHFEDETTLSAQQLTQTTSLVESQLRNLEIDKEKCLPVMLDQNPESYLLLLSLANLGWNCALLDSSFPVTTLEKMMHQLEAESVVFASRQAREVADSLSDNAHCITVSQQGGQEIAPGSKFLDGTVTIFSSGSTDHPKGVVHKWSKFFEWVKIRGDIAGATTTERWINFYPITWSFGLLNLLQVKTGADLYILDIKKNSPTMLWEKLLKIQPTNLSLTGQLAKALSASLGKTMGRKLSHLKKFGISGSNVNWETVNLFKEVMETDAVFNHNLSATEAIRMLNFNCPMQEIPPTGPVPLGQPLYPDRTLLKATGSKNLFQVFFEVGQDTHYLDRSHNLERFEIDDDGRRWWNSGDLVCLDELNNLYYYGGRIDDQVKINDHNVSLNQLSTTTEELNGVHRSCAVSVNLGERTRLFLFIELAVGQKLTQLEISEHISSRLPRYYLPHFIQILDAMPQNRSGKPDRRALIELVRKGHVE